MACSGSPDPKVGYMNPPVHSRFRKGQSGNPGGRPRRARQGALDAVQSREDALILRRLGEDVSLVVDGRLRRMPRSEALMRVLFEQALAGDLRAMKPALALQERTSAAKAASEAATLREGSGELTVAFARLLRRAKLEEGLGRLPGEQSGTAEGCGQPDTAKGADSPAPDGAELDPDHAAASDNHAPDRDGDAPASVMAGSGEKRSPPPPSVSAG
jgi:hypothetical protein